MYEQYKVDGAYGSLLTEFYVYCVEEIQSRCITRNILQSTSVYASTLMNSVDVDSNSNLILRPQHEVLLVGEVIKMAYSAWMISKELSSPDGNNGISSSLTSRLTYLVARSQKMFVLALIYGVMNILSFVALRNISAGMFTIFAQCKILTTATFSAIILQREYSWTQWRALLALLFGVLLFSEPIWGDPDKQVVMDGANTLLGTFAVLTEVTLSGFASIYFEKVIKIDPERLSIWERNFQLALGSFPIYLIFICLDAGGEAGFFGGWSFLAVVLSALGAAGGLLVALSIKYGDSILKTLATTGAIILSSILDRVFLSGPLTPSMMIAGVHVIIAICNYTFDTTPAPSPPVATEQTGKELSKTDDYTENEDDPLLRESDSFKENRRDTGTPMKRAASVEV